MIEKSTLEDLPSLKTRAKEPLGELEVNVEIFSSSVQSIKGYCYAVVFVDCHTGYIWLYGIKAKSVPIKMLKK
jgi:hypothetical protein